MAEATRINLTNQFLIAMPGMADPMFAGSVVYLCVHSDIPRNAGPIPALTSDEFINFYFLRVYFV